MKHQKSISEGYEKQLPRVQEQMAKELNEKEIAIEKLKFENDKFKVSVLMHLGTRYLHPAIGSRDAPEAAI